MDAAYFQKRIGWQGDIKILLSRICHDYGIGHYLGHVVVLAGYTDFNTILTTDQGEYFIKAFTNSGDLEDCHRYIEIILKAIEAGVKHPALFKSPHGYLYEVEIDSFPIRLCVMQYIEGKSLYDLNESGQLKDIPFFAQQAALINQINLKPFAVYDTWAIVNLQEEYAKTKQHLAPTDEKLIQPLLQKLAALDVANLPHCLVHGDIRKTNVLRDRAGGLYILDFSAANYYPRIQELAVLLCNILFNEDDPGSFTEFYNLALAEYQKYITLTPAEISAMPTYVQAAHAIHIIGPTYEKIVNGNNTPENDYWLKLGRIGLQYTSKLWPD